jgi:hypothetical protein
MSPSGCNRHCDHCDKIIHDLEQLTSDEAEALIRSGTEVCVRAKINAEGAIQLRPSPRSSVGRLVAASIGMLAMAAPATAAKPEPRGIIVGHDTGAYFKTKVTAVGTDGRKYHGKVGVDGRYEIRGVPPGTYELRFSEHCPSGGSSRWTGPTVIVQDDIVEAAPSEGSVGCEIIIGMIEAQGRSG